MAAPNTISIDKLVRLIGTPKCPALVDVRPQNDFEVDPHLIPSAIHCAFDHLEDRVEAYRRQSAIVICQNGAVHALMPGHGKTVLVSYHLGQPAKLREGIANGAILALTHVGLAVVLVLAGFAVISRALAGARRNSRLQAAC
jgi:hypothetical protein